MNKFCTSLLFPPTRVILLLVPVSVTLLVYSFVFQKETDIISYVSYVLSAYTLTVVCIRTPGWIRFWKTMRRENRYLVLWFSDAYLRMKLSLYASVGLNMAYALFQLAMGLWHASVWFYALAAYYALLVLMRVFLLGDIRAMVPGGRPTSLSDALDNAFTEGALIKKPGENRFEELLRYRFCGVILLFMNLALGVIVTFIVYQNRGFVHHPITTIAMAAYTFTTFILAIKNVIKYRRYQSPLYSAAKVITLAAASVSMLTLESAMLTTFGQENSETFRRVMTGAAGGAVCLFILVMAVYMIVTSTREINQIQKEAAANNRQEQSEQPA